MSSLVRESEAINENKRYVVKMKLSSTTTCITLVQGQRHPSDDVFAGLQIHYHSFQIPRC